MKPYLQLFLTFAKIGAFTFGGGYAMIPLIQRETAEKHHWVEEKDILDIVTIAESTPGPIAVNAATFVGYRVGGVFGAACATFGLILPSFLIIYLVSFLLREFADLPPVRYAFEGLRVGVLALICKALWSMYKRCPKGLVAYLLMAAAFALAAFTNINVIFIILACGITGLLVGLIGGKKATK